MRSLRGRKGWIPDFLTPRPDTARPRLEAELDELGAPRRRWSCATWPAHTAPTCPTPSLLHADITDRSHRIATGGAAALFADLDERITWRDGVLLADLPGLDADVQVAGRGLPLMPSIFPTKVTALIDSGQPPVLTYPVRGLATLTTAPDTVESPMATLIGRTRAPLLLALHEPASTTQLAHAHGLTPGAVSQHLSVLLTNGLLTRAHSGHHVLYEQTPFAQRLLRAHDSA